MVEEKYPNKFTFASDKDQGLTGRFEVTIYKSDKPAEKALVHSKANGDCLPNADYNAFFARLDEKMKGL